MVKGFELFQARLGSFEDAYVVIGGTACDLALKDFGGFRATKDIDMLIVTEHVDVTFAKALRDFLKEGSYTNYVTKDRKPHYYRFVAPKGSLYPAQIEMLSHSLIPERENVRFTPISLDDGIRSLSAIVLDPVYYEFVKTQRDVSHGVPSLNPEALVVLKSAAYLNLLADRRRSPSSVRSEDLHKHRNDVFRLLGVIPSGESIELPQSIRARMDEFIRHMDVLNPEWADVAAAVGPLALSPADYVERFRRLFAL